MLEKVISGGQNGVDQAGLRAAKKCGLITGGWMPKDCITLDGFKTEFLEEFGMKEHPKLGYPPRTEANVKDADATIRIAGDFSSAGEKCTLKFIKWHNKPYLNIKIESLTPISEVVEWLKKNNVKVLNVAGNSEKTCPGIGLKSEEYLEQLFNQCTEKSKFSSQTNA